MRALERNGASFSMFKEPELEKGGFDDTRSAREQRKAIGPDSQG
jgi:hypothetical protein